MTTTEEKLAKAQEYLKKLEAQDKREKKKERERIAMLLLNEVEIRVGKQLTEDMIKPFLDGVTNSNEEDSEDVEVDDDNDKSRW